MKMFMDSEFTGLKKQANLISLALIAEDGRFFYAEFTDHGARSKWLLDNVIPKLVMDSVSFKKINVSENATRIKKWSVQVCNNRREVAGELKEWLKQFDKIEIWSDCLAYDWVLFCDLFGGAITLPENIYYIPFDICTYFKLMGIDADIDREEFADGYIDTCRYGIDPEEIEKHNALWDAYIIKACYHHLEEIKSADWCEKIIKGERWNEKRL